MGKWMIEWMNVWMNKCLNEWENEILNESKNQGSEQESFSFFFHPEINWWKLDQNLPFEISSCFSSPVLRDLSPSLDSLTLDLPAHLLVQQSNRKYRKGLSPFVGLRIVSDTKSLVRSSVCFFLTVSLHVLIMWHIRRERWTNRKMKQLNSKGGSQNMLFDHLFLYRTSPWPKTAEKQPTDRRTDQRTDRPSHRDAFLMDASKNRKKKIAKQ